MKTEIKQDVNRVYCQLCQQVKKPESFAEMRAERNGFSVYWVGVCKLCAGEVEE